MFLSLQYLDNNAAVLLMINWFAFSSNSFILVWLISISLSVASESRPLRMGSSKNLRKSDGVPSTFGMTNDNKAKYSDKSFCDWRKKGMRLTKN